MRHHAAHKAPAALHKTPCWQVAAIITICKIKSNIFVSGVLTRLGGAICTPLFRNVCIAFTPVNPTAAGRAMTTKEVLGSALNTGDL